MTAVVALLTDFGLTDHYVGTMKAVILSKSGNAQFVDLTHDIPPQNVRAAAYQLLACYRFHPAGTLFLCVVDPGVGSDRRLLYVEAGGWKFLAPDNGLLSWVLASEKPTLLVDVSSPPGLAPDVSRTFHGRDILAPVASRLLNGEKPETLGRRLGDYAKIPFPEVRKSGNEWAAEIIALDRFGNLITNVRSSEILPVAAKSKVAFDLGKKANAVRGLSENYASVAEGRLLAIAGSAGFVEISVRNGSAEKATGLGVGDAVTVHFRT